MLKKTSDNPNYYVKLVKLPPLRKHSKADRLNCVLIDGNNVITGLAAKENDLYIYFPIESAINKQYLSWSNSFSDAELNADKTKKGFFPSAGRVKCLKLRDEKSEGYIVPAKDISNWLESIGVKYIFNEEDAGVEFDTIGDVLFCEKYVNTKQRNLDKAAQVKSKKKVARVSKIIDNQFRFHEDTQQFGKFYNKLNSGDYISVTEKLHGTSFVAAKVLCKKPLKWYERALKLMGVNVVDTHYDLVYSSRAVIKNKYNDIKNSGSYYDCDVWGEVARKLEPLLFDGLSLYGEIVGKTPTGKWIQPQYDYGTDGYDYYIYRATITNYSGKVIELSWPQIKSLCIKMGIKHVPEHFYGEVYHLTHTYPNSEEGPWSPDVVLEYLKNKYLEMDCPICKNVVPREGVVIRVESDNYDAYKLKSFRFKLKESSDLDKGTLDMETQESSENIE